MSEKRLIYIFLCLGCMTISFNVAAIAAALPAIGQDLRLPDILVSKIIPFYMIPYGITALIYAPLTKRFSYRLILGVPLALYAFFSFYCASIHSIDRFFVGRVGMGVAAAASIPLGLLVIGQLFEKNVRGRLVGLFFSCSFFASMAGILLSGFAGWRWLFYVPALLGGSTAAGILAAPTKLLDTIHGADVNYFRAFRISGIRYIFMFIFSISFLYHGVHQWFGVYLSKVYSLDKLAISFFFMTMSIGSALGQLAGGHISDRHTRYIACQIGIVVLAVATMSLLGRYPLPVLCFLLTAVGAGWTIGHNGISTVLTDFPPEYRPELASLNSAVRFISGGLGFFISSFFVEKSFGITFFVLGALMFVLGPVLRKIIPDGSRQNFT